MDETLKGIRTVGFDLDGTLYKLTDEMNDRIRNKVSEKILLKMPSLENVRDARGFFESNYQELHRATEVLRKAGYENPSQIMDECIANADILDLIPRNESLNLIIERLYEKYGEIYLLTSSPRELSLAKLGRIGIDANLFSRRFYSDIPGIGSKLEGEAFDYVLKKSIYKAPQHVYVGDRVNSDIIPAKKRGMKSILVHGISEEADFCILGINELEGILL